MPEVAALKAQIQVEGAAAGAAQLEAFGGAVSRAGASQGTAAQQSAQHDAAMRRMGTGAMIAGALVVGGIGLAVNATMDFDKAISGVGAVSDATSGQLDQLRQAAIEAGQATVFSATDAANAEAELAKAGLSTADILGGALRGSLDLAAAGQLDLATAATITAQALNIFKLDGDKASHVADVLAAGANKSAADVRELGDALRQGGLLAAQTGLSLEDTVGVLALFADNALIGSDAGTSLKTMLQRLTPQSQEAKDKLAELGISAYDASGQFVGLEQFAGQLQEGMKNLTPEARNAAMSVIFGSDAVRAANLLYNAGAEGVREYVTAVNDQGAASRMAGVQLDNLAGDVEQLSGSIETGLIGSGSAATSVLRFLAQGATDAVNGFSNLPGPVQTTVFGLLAFSGGGLAAVGTTTMLIGKFREWKATADTVSPALGNVVSGLGKMAAGAAIAGVSMSLLGEGSETAGVGILGMTASGALMGSTFGPAGTAIGAAAGFVGGLTMQLMDGGESIDDYRERIAGLGSELDSLGQKAAGEKFLGSLGNDDALGAITGNVRAITDELTALASKSPAAGEKVVAALKAMRDESGKPVFKKSDWDELDAAVAKGTGRYQDHAVAAKGARDANAALDPTLQDVAGSTDDVADAFKDADDAASKFKSTLDHVLGIGLDAESANLKWRDSLDAVAKGLVDNGATLDINTAAGRANRDNLVGSTQDALTYAEALFRQTGNMEASNFVIGAQISQLQASAAQMGLNDAETLNYIEDLFNIPADARTDIHNTAELANYLVAVYTNTIVGVPTDWLTMFRVDTSAAEASIRRLEAQLGTVRQNIGFPNEPINAAVGMVVPARSGGTLVNVGEGGATEVIVPTNDLDRARALLTQGGLARLFADNTTNGDTPSYEPAVNTSEPVVQHFHFYGQMDPHDAADRFAWELLRQRN